MMDLILETARKDGWALAAYLRGSRTNVHVPMPKDVYQDFDIMYVVKEVVPLLDKIRCLPRFPPTDKKFLVRKLTGK